MSIKYEPSSEPIHISRVGVGRHPRAVVGQVEVEPGLGLAFLPSRTCSLGVMVQGSGFRVEGPGFRV